MHSASARSCKRRGARPRSSELTAVRGGGASPDRALVGAYAVPIAAPVDAARPVAVTRSAGFIASPLYDTVLFILAPVLALALVVPVGASPWALRWQPVLGIVERPAVLFILVWSQAHALATFFRSHGNRAIFVRHRFAFVGVPVLLFLGLMASDWVMVSALDLAPFWAVYHIGMQSFGIGRIYDARRGNRPEVGRPSTSGFISSSTSGRSWRGGVCWRTWNRSAFSARWDGARPSSGPGPTARSRALVPGCWSWSARSSSHSTSAPTGGSPRKDTGSLRRRSRSSSPRRGCPSPPGDSSAPGRPSSS